MTPLLAVEDVTVRFGATAALDRVSLALHRGEALGVVGGSGSGKTTLLRVLLRLQPVQGGRVTLDGADLARGAVHALRARVQCVFQNPHAALDPRFTVADAVAEPLRIQGRLGRAARRDRVAALLADVGLGAQHLTRRPHELSGGQAQRVCIARALAPLVDEAGPRALLLDEPTSALDVSVQAGVIELLQTLRARHGLALLFVSHNLAVVRLLCERVVVMQRGAVVEDGPAAQVLSAPRHEVTRALLAAVLPPRATLAAVAGPVTSEP